MIMRSCAIGEGGCATGEFWGGESGWRTVSKYVVYFNKLSKRYSVYNPGCVCLDVTGNISGSKAFGNIFTAVNVR